MFLIPQPALSPATVQAPGTVCSPQHLWPPSRLGEPGHAVLESRSCRGTGKDAGLRSAGHRVVLLQPQSGYSVWYTSPSKPRLGNHFHSQVGGRGARMRLKVYLCLYVGVSHLRGLPLSCIRPEPPPPCGLYPECGECHRAGGSRWLLSLRDAASSGRRRSPPAGPPGGCSPASFSSCPTEISR